MNPVLDKHTITTQFFEHLVAFQHLKKKKTIWKLIYDLDFFQKSTWSIFKGPEKLTRHTRDVADVADAPSRPYLKQIPSHDADGEKMGNLHELILSLQNVYDAIYCIHI